MAARDIDDMGDWDEAKIVRFKTHILNYFADTETIRAEIEYFQDNEDAEYGDDDDDDDDDETRDED